MLPPNDTERLFRLYDRKALPRTAAGILTLITAACFSLGCFLGIVFLFAAVLIMYYKQISEGYEDQSRFGIMQKVG